MLVMKRGFWTAGFLILAASAFCEEEADDVEKRVSHVLSVTGFRREVSASAEQVELGRRLFFDPGLSSGGKMSCATCHVPGRHFGDGLPRAVGRGGKRLPRNTPSLLTARYYSEMLWDGRAPTIEDAVLNAIDNPDEMAQPLPALAARLGAGRGYAAAFSDAYPGTPISSRTIGGALGAFVMSLQPPEDSPFDRFLEDRKGLRPDALRGFMLFSGRAGCILCHPSRNLKYDARYRNTGLAPGEIPDIGRYRVDPQPDLWGAFRVPSLRNVARSAPYMHDGRFATLVEVIDFYDRGGDPSRHKDPLIKPLSLTREEKRDLLAFLQALTTSLKPLGGTPERR